MYMLIFQKLKPFENYVFIADNSKTYINRASKIKLICNIVI